MPLQTGAAEVSLAGVSASRAVFVVDGTTRILRPGQTLSTGIKLLAVEGDGAKLEHLGRTIVLRVGQRLPGAPLEEQTVSLQANPQGHFFVTGSVNGEAIRFLVDTGATMVSLGASDARRIGIRTDGGETSYAQTAAGVVAVTRVRLDRVVVGDIELDGIDALVHGNDLPIALLGMSFLNRTDMRRAGSTMTLKKRY